MAECGSAISPSEASSGTSPGLLERVRGGDASAWDRLVTLYAPLVYHWCRRAQLQEHDAEDVFQEVFQALLTHIGGFRKALPGDTFRGWLFTITANKIRDHFRRTGREPRGEGGTEALVRLSRIAAPERDDPPPATPCGADLPDLATLSGGGVERDLFRRALELIRSEFKEQTWRAFWRAAVDGQPAAGVAAELGMSPGAVRVAKSRVLRRLREALGDAV